MSVCPLPGPALATSGPVADSVHRRIDAAPKQQSLDDNSTTTARAAEGRQLPVPQKVFNL